MTFIDLFAGIGGFRRGMEMAGHKCLGFCEFDKFAVASYTVMHLMTDEDREYIKTLPFNKRLKEALKEEYRHGEWYSSDIRRLRADDIPGADVWCFGFPCQDISVAGKQKGLAGNRSGLFHTVIKLLQDTEEENRPSVLFIENVKNLLSVNRGYDFLSVLVELDKIGYDAEWQVINSADYVPQNRERVFIIGHLRGRSGREVFPVERTNGENRVSIIGHRDGYRRNSQTYSPEGITEALDTATGGGRVFNIAQPIILDKNAGGEEREIANCITSREDRGVANTKQTGTAIAIPIGGMKPFNSERFGSGCICEGNSYTLRADKHDASVALAIPVFSPDRAEKCQNGRRFKEDGEPMFTLTGQGKHGAMVSYANKSIAAVWSDKYQCNIAIRKLNPKECFRLQGWEDTYFDRAALVSSDSQLYKQAGNGVTVPVIYDMARRF